MAKGKTIIAPEVMDFIIKALNKINFGQLVLVAQDGVLVQIEKSEKIKITNNKLLVIEKYEEKNNQQKIKLAIEKEFSKLCYGQLTIVVKGNSVLQIEKTEKQRFMGLDGDGI